MEDQQCEHECKYEAGDMSEADVDKLWQRVMEQCAPEERNVGKIVVIHTWGARLRAVAGLVAHLGAITVLLCLFFGVVPSASLAWAIFLLLVAYGFTLLGR